MSTSRTAFGGDHLGAAFEARSYGGRIEGGYRFATAFAGITPYAAAQAQLFRTRGYSETDPSGGNLGLSYAARDATAARAEIGSRFDRELALVNIDAVMTLRGRLAGPMTGSAIPAWWRASRACPARVSSSVARGPRPITRWCRPAASCVGAPAGRLPSSSTASPQATPRPTPAQGRCAVIGDATHARRVIGRGPDSFGRQSRYFRSERESALPSAAARSRGVASSLALHSPKEEGQALGGLTLTLSLSKFPLDLRATMSWGSVVKA